MAVDPTTFDEHMVDPLTAMANSDEDAPNFGTSQASLKDEDCFLLAGDHDDIIGFAEGYFAVTRGFCPASCCRSAGADRSCSALPAQVIMCTSRRT